MQHKRFTYIPYFITYKEFETYSTNKCRQKSQMICPSVYFMTKPVPVTAILCK